MHRLPADHAVEERPTLPVVSALNDGRHHQLGENDPQAQRDHGEAQPPADSGPAPISAHCWLHWVSASNDFVHRSMQRGTARNVKGAQLANASRLVTARANLGW